MALATPSAQVQPQALPIAVPLQTEVAQAQPVTIHRAQYPYAAPQVQTANPFEQYKAYLAGRARAAGVRQTTIQAVIPYLRLNQRAMELDRAQRPTPVSTSGSPPAFGTYLDRHITSSLITRGQARYSAHWPHLSRIQQLYGVDPAVVMAIYGKETSYGAVTGSFDLLEALASLG
jgi:membrane-bound lytic murein transglycosylase B